jgi:hypothetical protein
MTCPPVAYLPLKYKQKNGENLNRRRKNLYFLITPKKQVNLNVEMPTQMAIK